MWHPIFNEQNNLISIAKAVKAVLATHTDTPRQGCHEEGHKMECL